MNYSEYPDLQEDLSDYYDRRAPEYDQMYSRENPTLQAEFAAIKDAIRNCMSQRRVLEIGCGTGVWTQLIAQTAKEIIAVDISTQMLKIAKARCRSTGNVEFCRADAYSVSVLPQKFDAGLANFWFSHVPKKRIKDFLLGLHYKIGKRAVVFMVDNVFVERPGGELLSKPGSEDTFKRRKLADGSTYYILKNYYTSDQLKRIFKPIASGLNVSFGHHFWWVSYVVSDDIPFP